MKERFTITAIWLTGFIISLLIVESYVHTHTRAGVQLLFPEDRLPCMTTLVEIFGAYIGGMLAFWFVKPFKPAKTDAAEKIRFGLALTCSLLFVLTLLFFVSYVHIFGPGENSVQQNIVTGRKLAVLLSFIIAPVNLYYFGMKVKLGAKGV